LRFAVFAAPFKAKAPNASVLVVVQADGRDLRLIEKDSVFSDTLEMSMMALDKDGKVQGGTRQELTLTLKPDTNAAVRRAGVRMMDRLNLRPGRYQLRVVAASAAPGVVGSVNYNLEIPDFMAAHISMSGLVLTSSRAAETPSANMDPDIKRSLPGPPTTRRVFSVGEELALLAEVYDTQGSIPHKVDIVTTVQSEDGRALFTHADERSSSEIGGASGGFGYTARVPLKGIRRLYC
jgi:hypothetical protein